MAVDAPRLQSSLHDEVMAGTPDVVHDVFTAIFLKCFADARAKSFQHFVPRSARPLSTAARTGALHRVENAVGIVNLSDCRGPLGAKPPAACGMLRVALKLCDSSR